MSNPQAKMTDKAIVSAYTYRPIPEQIKNSGGFPIFVLPDDLPQLFRPTVRKQSDRYHVESIAILAEREDAFREFLAEAKKRNGEIISREENHTFKVNGNTETLVKWWKDARRRGSAIEGGKKGGAILRAAVDERLKGFTKDEWTNGNIKNAQLIKKYKTSLGALRRYASDKGWGWNRQQAIWRAEQKKGRKLQLPVKG